MTYQQIKARRFAEALEEWDEFKRELNARLTNGEITKETYDMLLERKAEELDL